MTLYPIRRPRLGVHIDPQALTVVEVGRDWHRGGYGLRLNDCRQLTLPTGLLRLSSTEPNILDMQAMTNHLVEALGRRGRRCLTLSLPDHCARIALFDFETLPQKPSEIDGLLRWRLQKDLNMPAGQTRMQYRVFRPASGAGKVENQLIRVLVAAVREDIVSQYEQLCEAVGAIPVSIGLSSLALLGWWRSLMTDHPTEALFLHATDCGFTFMAFREGCPAFLRSKGLPVEPTEEILATLHYYADRDAGRVPIQDQASPPLYMVKEQDWEIPPDSVDLPPLKLINLGWHSVRVARRSLPEHLPFSGLPALATLLAA